MEQSSVRLPPEIVRRIDTLVPRIAERALDDGGPVRCSRSEVMREALDRGLEVLEQELAREVSEK
jgi:Arc/MetJ-type ribon-helix-helix transcriptional regulator